MYPIITLQVFNLYVQRSESGLVRKLRHDFGLSLTAKQEEHHDLTTVCPERTIPDLPTTEKIGAPLQVPPNQFAGRSNAVSALSRTHTKGVGRELP